MAPSVSPDRTTCFTASVPELAAAGATNGSFALAGAPPPLSFPAATPDAVLLGMISFWPGRRTALVERPLAAVSCARVILFFRAIVERLSPDFTVYDVAGVTSATGCVCSAPATGVPGRVG